MQSNKTITITAALLILTILAAGCISTDSVQTKTAAQGNQIDAKETPPKVEAESAPVETHWWDGQSGYTPITISADDNLFGVELNGVKYQENTRAYELYNENQNRIFLHEPYSPEGLHLERELGGQYSVLDAEYGHPNLIIMEKIDTDGGGMDKVALKYVGSKGSFEFITDYDNGWDNVDYYISKGIYFNLI